ncbi:hypothetical protein CI610_01074 [invertebrate metagenome]|uniref:Uncharacterized protein n=1 Tax=invertebrate metagenome TaxID=1711999 RepID=A0A2H9T9Z5_9ZZZZ
MLIGENSAIAPLWASLITLINEVRAKKKNSPLSFININDQLAANYTFFN